MAENAARTEILKMRAKKDAPVESTAKERFVNWWWYHWRGFMSIFFFIIWIPLLFLKVKYDTIPPCLFLMTTYFCFMCLEILPPPVIAVFPFLLIPCLGIEKALGVAASYFTSATFLAAAGVWFAISMIHSRLSTRLGLLLARSIGSNVKKCLAIVMILTFSCCLLINSIFFCPLMFPIIETMLKAYEDQGLIKTTGRADPTLKDSPPPEPSRAAKAFYLGITYSSLLGGCNTWFGSQLVQEYKMIYKKSVANVLSPNQADVYRMAAFTIFPSILLLLITYLWLLLIFIILKVKSDIPPEESKDAKPLDTQLEDLGPMSRHEIAVLSVLILVILLFLTREPLFCPGWSVLFEKHVNDVQPAMASLILFTLFPITCACFTYFVCRRPNPEGTLDSILVPRPFLKYTPWAILLLIGSGNALAKALEFSKITNYYFEDLVNYKDRLKTQVWILTTIGVLNFICFNRALLHILLPVILNHAALRDVKPGPLGVPALMMGGCPFMFPGSSAQTLICHLWGNVRVYDMIVAGLPLEIMSFLIILFFGSTWIFVLWPGWK